METRKTILQDYNSLSIDETNRIIEHYISTEAVNRYGYILKNDGMNTKNYELNPIVLYQHSSGRGFFSEIIKPSELIIGKNISLSKDSKGIIAKTQFDNSELADDIFNMNVSGLMHAWSVSWMSSEKFIEVENIPTMFLWELIEYSSVVIPANPEAVNKMLSLSNSQAMKKSLSLELMVIDLKENLKSEIKEIAGNKNDLTKKDLIDFKNEIKSLVNNNKKQFNDNLMNLTLKTINLESNLHNKILSKMENIIETSIKKLLGKLD